MTLSRNPQHVDDRTWYYEYQHHIEVIHEVRSRYDDDKYIQTDSIKIPWQKLLASSKRRTT